MPRLGRRNRRHSQACEYSRMAGTSLPSENPSSRLACPNFPWAECRHQSSGSIKCTHIICTKNRVRRALILYQHKFERNLTCTFSLFLLIMASASTSTQCRLHTLFRAQYDYVGYIIEIGAWCIKGCGFYQRLDCNLNINQPPQ